MRYSLGAHTTKLRTSRVNAQVYWWGKKETQEHSQEWLCYETQEHSQEWLCYETQEHRLKPMLPGGVCYGGGGVQSADMDNKQIARILRETAQLLEIDGAIIGRYRSYERAAELIDGLPQPVEQLVETPEKLAELPGIGERMVEHLTEIVKTGDYALRKKLLKKYPETILDLLNLQSLGPKKVGILWKNFKAGTVADVEKLAKEGKLRKLAGFGEKSEQNILKAVEVFKKSSGRFLISTAEAAAVAIAEHIRKAGKCGGERDACGVVEKGGRRRWEIWISGDDGGEGR